ncbi:MAG: DUF362 domain-containing protein [Muribaculaceae bacterium]|nr:DUF362 domain-containing protein [Muribaculaceae bacterium]
MASFPKLIFKAVMAFILTFCATTYAAETTYFSRHDFFYAGESKQPRMFIVKNGHIDWQHTASDRKGEISDAILLTDGDILIANQYGIDEISPDHKTVMSYDAPEGCEIHTIQPIGEDKVLFVQNGKPAKVVVMEIPSLKILKEFPLPVSEKGSVHGQFRNARLTSKGTLLVSNMGLGFVAEYNSDGKEIDRWDIQGPWSATEVGKAGNLLIVGKGSRVKEIDRRGNVLWEKNLSDYGVTSPQKAVRLKNGNTLINNWYNEWNKTPMDSLNAPVQAIEITPEGEMVWSLCAWKDPDLGPSTTIQPLDQIVNRKNMFFGEFNPRSPRLFVGPNQPIGKPVGAVPGRVAWIHAPGVAKWDGRTGLWVEDRWNDQEIADNMIKETIAAVGGKKNAKEGWDAMFKNFNSRHAKGSKGYKKGEKIAIKLNLNNAITHRDTIELNSSPFVTLALVRSLVKDGGVRPSDIIICEPSRAITDSIYFKINREYPDVIFIDNIGGEGRLKCEYYPEALTYSIDNGKMARGLAKCIVDADYVINSALLKTHSGPGVTLTGKNWYGATDIALQWRKNAHNNVSQDKRNGKPGYKTFVDFIAHPQLGGKCLLFLIDGTYGSRDVNGAPYPKWQKEPFNGDWACSIIASQDPLAADAVAMDLIIGEWPEFGSLNYCDEYLREAASIPNAPSGTVYKVNDKPLTEPLGIMEHWNNPKERHYEAIDLEYRKID